MKFNGATFNKAQQDQLKKKVGAELDEIIAKVDDVDSRILNYTGDWVTDNEYHENDVVTWTDGHLYEVIKAHTSSATLDPDNSEYYKAMTATKKRSRVILLSAINDLRAFIKAHPDAIAYLTYPSGDINLIPMHKSGDDYFVGFSVPYENPLELNSISIIALSRYDGSYKYKSYDMVTNTLSVVSPSPAYDRVTFYY